MEENEIWVGNTKPGDYLGSGKCLFIEGGPSLFPLGQMNGGLGGRRLLEGQEREGHTQSTAHLFDQAK